MRLLAVVIAGFSFAPAAWAAPSLRIPAAERAIVSVAKSEDHPEALQVEDCHHRGSAIVSCTLVEQITTPGLIEVLEGSATVTLEQHRHPAYSYLRVHIE